MDIVYPLGIGSKFKDDFELKISLRSLEAQPWIENTYIIGHCPKWLSNVTHISCEDPYKSKDANIINKILRVCCEEKLTEDFIVNSDDQCFLKIIDPKDIGPYLERNSPLLNYKIKRHTANNWNKRVFQTVDWCKNHGYPQWIFQSHTPYIVNKKDYPMFMSNAPWAEGNGTTTHIYLNMSLAVNPIIEPPRFVLRVKQPMTPIGLQQQSKGFMLLNFNNNGLNESLKRFLLGKFPKPSRWEK